jgi:hypothetical protein
VLLRPAKTSELGIAVAIDDDASDLYLTAGIALRFPSKPPRLLP